MSLINDALKRAKQAQQQNPFQGSPGMPLQPVDYARRPNYFVRSVVALLAVVTLGCSGWFFWKWWNSPGDRRTVVPSRVAKVGTAAHLNAPTQSLPRKAAIQVSTNIVVRTNVPVAPALELQSPQSTNALISTPASNAVPVAAAAEPALPASPFADLKLRSIIYREDKPAAVINGDMLYVGDDIRGARVIRIERYSVTVERKGETNELRLPRL